MAALFLTAVAMGIRLHGLDSQSPWIDEIYSHRVAAQPLAEIMAARPISKPPLDYWLQHLSMQLLGDSAAAQRLPAAIAGGLTPLALFALINALFGPSAGVAAAAALAFSPLHLRFSQEARPYSLMLLLITLAAWTLVAIQQRDTHRVRYWALHVVTVIAAVWTHYLSILWLVLLQSWCLAVWLRARGTDRGRQSLTAAWGSGLALLIGLVSLMPTWIWHGEGAGAEYPFSVSVHALFQTLLVFSFGLEHGQFPVMTSLLGLAMAALGIIWAWRRSVSGAALLLVLFGGMWGLCFVIYWAIDRWVATRYLTPGLLPLVAMQGLGVVAVAEVIARGFPSRWGSPVRRAAIALLLFIAAMGLMAAVWMIRNPFLKEDWRGLVTWIGDNTLDDSLVIVVDPLHVVPIEFNSRQMEIPIRVDLETDLGKLQRRIAENGDCIVLLPGGMKSGPLYEWLSEQSPVESPFLHFQIWRLTGDADSE